MLTNLLHEHRDKLRQFTLQLTAAISTIVFSTSPAQAQSQPTTADLVTNARAVLERACTGCHGGKDYGRSTVPHFSDILNFEMLTRQRSGPGKIPYVTPSDPNLSYLWQRIDKNQMPPNTPLSVDDKNAIRTWIAAGAPSPIQVAAKAPNQLTVLKTVERLIFDDLQQMDPVEQRFARYFTLVNSWNADLPKAEFEQVQRATVKLLNSLSWGTAVVIPRVIDRDASLLRIDLRTLGWNSGVWEILQRANPYGIVTNSLCVPGLAYATGTKVPYLRAEWFVAFASKPPLYQQILYPGMFSIQDVERRLEISSQQNIVRGEVMRSGFNESGISNNNRLIERHKTKFGAYWRSYDFGGNIGVKNLFERPLGPDNVAARGFHPDGGEVIFNLPNGFQAYALLNAAGILIESAPVNIVFDKQRGSAVENGISCIGCHVDGIKRKDDQLRPHVLANSANFTPDAIRAILAIHPEHQVLDAVVKADANRYLAALAKAGTAAKGGDPVSAVAAVFFESVGLPAAAAELGLTAAELRRHIEQSPRLRQVLGPLLIDGGTVKRDKFLDALRIAVPELAIGAFI